jgi:hypothetical protein
VPAPTKESDVTTATKRSKALIFSVLVALAGLLPLLTTPSTAAADEAPASADPRIVETDSGPVQLCQTMTAELVTVTVLVAATDLSTCADPQTETFETCVLEIATHFGAALTRERIDPCVPPEPPHFDGVPDSIDDRTVNASRGRGSARIDLTGTDSCESPPSHRPDVIAPTQAKVGVGFKFDVNARVQLLVTVGDVPLEKVPKMVQQFALDPGANVPGKQAQTPVDSAAQKKAGDAVKPPEQQQAGVPGISNEALKWVPNSSPSEPGDYPEPKGDGTAVATPVDPLTDQETAERLPCEVAQTACSALGKKLAPAKCEDPQSEALKEHRCDGTLVYTTDERPCEAERVREVDEIDVPDDPLLLDCLAVRRVVEGDDPCHPGGPPSDISYASAVAMMEAECRSLVHTDPGAGGGDDPCAVPAHPERDDRPVAGPTDGGKPPPVLPVGENPPGTRP